MEDYIKHNQRAWDQQVANKNQWTIPVSSEDIAQARLGNWEVRLTPWRAVPRNWFPDLHGIDILCLASGGGQQAPVFAAGGANVVVLDISPEQLKQDEKTARQNDLIIETILGDMSDLSCFPDHRFDLVFHPVSNCFIRNVHPVWRETCRVLKSKGILLSGFANPVLYLFDDSDSQNINPIEVKNRIPYSDLDTLTENQKKEYSEKGYPYEFGHTLEDQISGQLEAGFVITGFYEDKHHLKDHPLYTYISTFAATRAIKVDRSDQIRMPL